MARVSSSVVQKILGRVVAYHAAFTLLPGVSVPGAVFLSQAFYWTRNTRAEERGGWFYKNQRGRDSWESETGLSPKQQANARRSLVEIGVLEEERRDVPAKMWYRVNCERLLELLAEKFDDEPPGSGCKSQFFPLVDSTIPYGQSGGPDGQSLILPKGESITESTTENTTRNKGGTAKAENFPGRESKLSRAELAEMLGQQRADLIARNYGSDKVGTPAVDEMRRTLRTQYSRGAERGDGPGRA
ncbi:hypothetical protein [Pistricoccus aurantiacus]|uniref:hypothetical protein n=1 Tax=Pistricoccus aurantiacus TaxID=1883414 RepID=UPI0036443B93